VLSIKISTSTEVTTRRGELRRKAHEQLSKAASSMKKSVVDGQKQTVHSGRSCACTAKDMDKAMADSGSNVCLTN
jgi:hypothetical protein